MPRIYLLTAVALFGLTQGCHEAPSLVAPTNPTDVSPRAQATENTSATVDRDAKLSGFRSITLEVSDPVQFNKRAEAGFDRTQITGGPVQCILEQRFGVAEYGAGHSMELDIHSRINESGREPGQVWAASNGRIHLVCIKPNNTVDQAWTLADLDSGLAGIAQVRGNE